MLVPPDHGSGAAQARTDLTIVIPAYNEAHRMRASFARLLRSAELGAFDPAVTQVVLVDDGSTDATAELAVHLLGALPHVEHVSLGANRGKGVAVRTGVLRARSPVVAFVDADMAMDPTQLPALLKGLATNDISIADRTLPGSRAEGPHLRRQIASTVSSRAVRTLTGLDLPDTQCGFKAFRTPAARLLFHWCAIDRFAFDVELLDRARRFGLGIARTPVTWRRVGGSRVRTLPDVTRMALDVLSIRVGRRAPRSVDALVLDDVTGRDLGTLRAVVGPTLPVVVDTRAQSATVLLTMCDTRHATEIRDRIRSRLPDIPVHGTRVTSLELESRAPLRLLQWQAAIAPANPS